MDVCQKTSDSRKMGLGAKELSSAKASCTNQQKVEAPASTANTSKRTRPNCFDTKPRTVKQSEVSEPRETNGTGNQHQRQKTFPVPKNVR